MAVACGLRAELMSALMKASFQRSLLSTTLYRPDTQPPLPVFLRFSST